MMVLGITTQPLLVLVRAWPKLPSSNHAYLFVKTLQTNSSCCQNNENTNFLLWPCLSHIPATSRPYLQKEWEAVSQDFTKRKSAAGICCKNAFREGDNPSLEKQLTIFLLLLLPPLFCMHRYCLFRPPPVFFSAKGLVAPFQPSLFNLQLCSQPAWGHLLSHSCPYTRPQAHTGCSAHGSLSRFLVCHRQEGHCCLQDADCKSPVPSEHCQLPSRLEGKGCWRTRAGGMLSDQLCSYTSFLSIFLLVFASSPALA